MVRWLSATWEPSWRSFQYFNLYRFLVGVFLLACAFLPTGWMPVLRLFERQLFDGAVALYAVFTALGLFLSLHWNRRFNFQLTMQVAGDAVLLSLVMYALGGVSSGVGLVLLISMASASLVGRGRLVLFYAALATLGVLIAQSLVIWTGEHEASSMLQAGLLSAGFFATAILARLLGQRVMANEELARLRGIALANEIHIGKRMMERMQDGVLVLDAEGNVIRHNPGALPLLGQEVGGAFPLGECSSDLWGAFGVWVAGGEADTEFEAASGRRLHARFVSTESTDGAALVFLEDVTRIREQAQHLKLVALGRLTASIAHEIRNPLAAISHAADLMHEERRGEIHERLLQIVRDNVFRLDRIVQDVLKLGQSDRGASELLDLEEFVRGFMAEFFIVEKINSDLVVWEAGPGANQICFDRSQLLQVLWNLVGNALRHSRHQAGSVVVKSLLAGDGRVQLHVIDDGPGIPESLQAQIFEPFVTTRHQGLGLGLFIARELCEANGAALQFRRGNAGAHFVIDGGIQCQATEANDVSAVN